uniref:BPTI/Kunitz inhibitor domain-containing protein n=1 Tax=Caenorhabditis japonica TaxID=281687 RepID=A0A8R1DYJ1_CAEJA
MPSIPEILTTFSFTSVSTPPPSPPPSTPPPPPSSTSLPEFHHSTPPTPLSTSYPPFVPPLVPLLTTTTIPPLPTLLPPNIATFIQLPVPAPAPAPAGNHASPCSRPIHGDATIMCESRPEICPIGTFCQIGQGQSICCPIMDEPPCDQAIEEGVGVSLIRRWYFDPATRMCQPFHYKGFKGNQNNFQTFESCNRACGATLICPGGASPQMSIHTHLLSCNMDSDCTFLHSCIQSTPHNLCCPIVTLLPPTPVVVDPLSPTLIEQPEPSNNVDFAPALPLHNLCEQPINPGYGVLTEHRWAFVDGQCTSFLFAGQGGNMNNFLTRNDCLTTCGHGQGQGQGPETSTLATTQCSQPAASGHGEQYLSRFFFSPEYRQCLHFVYSGEGGNQNNFETLTDCLETCVANGVKFSSLANKPMPLPIVPLQTAPSRKVCPQGDPLITVDGTPIQCDPTKAAKCPGDHVCTPVDSEAYCCPSPMNFCLQNRPAISVCPGPEFEPVREIRFTYDPLADRCIRFSYQNCRAATTSPYSLNNFGSNSQCNRLCCNQGYNLVYKRRLLMALADDPMD